MKTKQLYLLFSLLVLLTACSPTEREQLNGKWKVSEIHMGKDLIYSTDPAEREKIVDRVIAEQKAKLPESAWGELEMMRKFFREKLENSGQTTLTIKEDNSYVSKTFGAGNPLTEKGKLTFDEKKKTLTLKSSSVQKFSYSFEKDKLMLTTNENGRALKLEFSRM